MQLIHFPCNFWWLHFYVCFFGEEIVVNIKHVAHRSVILYEESDSFEEWLLCHVGTWQQCRYDKMVLLWTQTLSSFTTTVLVPWSFQLHNSPLDVPIHRKRFLLHSQFHFNNNAFFFFFFFFFFLHATTIIIIIIIIIII